MVFSVSSTRSAPQPAVLRVPSIFPFDLIQPQGHPGNQRNQQQSTIYAASSDDATTQRLPPQPRGILPPQGTEPSRQGVPPGSLTARRGRTGRSGNPGSFMIKDILGSKDSDSVDSKKAFDSVDSIREETTFAANREDATFAPKAKTVQPDGHATGRPDNQPQPQPDFRPTSSSSSSSSSLHRHHHSSPSASPSYYFAARETTRDNSRPSPTPSSGGPGGVSRHPAGVDQLYPASSTSSAFTLLQSALHPLSVPPSGGMTVGSSQGSIPQLTKLPFPYDDQSLPVTPNPFVQSLHQIHNFHTSLAAVGSVTGGVFSPLGSYPRQANDLPYFARSNGYLANCKFKSGAIRTIFSFSMYTISHTAEYLQVMYERMIYLQALAGVEFSRQAATQGATSRHTGNYE